MRRHQRSMWRRLRSRRGLFDATISALDTEMFSLDAETSVLDAEMSALDVETSALARSSRRYRRGVSGDCGVGITPQMCNRVTNHGDMSTFSKPVTVPLSCLLVIWMAIIRSCWVLRPRTVIELRPLTTKPSLVAIIGCRPNPCTWWNTWPPDAWLMFLTWNINQHRCSKHRMLL